MPAGYARLLGLQGARVDQPEAVAAAWEQALQADRPTVLEMVTNPGARPSPAHVGAGRPPGAAGHAVCRSGGAPRSASAS